MTIALEPKQLKNLPRRVQALRGIDLQVEAGDFTRSWGRTARKIHHYRHYQFVGEQNLR